MTAMSARGMLVAWLAMVGAALVGCVAGPATPWAGESGASVPAPSISDLAYASASDAEVLDMWLPLAAPQPYPLVVFVHGGGWSRGDKRDVSLKVVPLLQRGFAV